MPAEPQDELDRGLERLASLTEGVRRRLYRYVVLQHRGVSRDEAAAGVGVARHTAKFHLDRLVEDGWLEVEFRRLGERSGPGAGRPSKLYRRTGREVAVQLPQRRYEFAAGLFAEAIVRSENSGEGIDEVVSVVAREQGRAVSAAAQSSGPGSQPGDRSTGVAAILDELGYEPERQPGSIVLHNCPFHSLAGTFRHLVCGMNLEFLSGLLDGHDGIAPSLDPQEGRCCVTISVDN